MKMVLPAFVGVVIALQAYIAFGFNLLQISTNIEKLSAQLQLFV
jgi:hypothetical protein